ncbi:MAG: hypothetical protein ACRDL8_00800 [Solirubrobacteraceae bacterium]
MRLHLESRRVPAALCAFVGCGLAFQATLRWYGDSGSLGQQIPPIFEAAVAAIVAVSTRSPIGEPERASGRWLPFLRLGTAVALSAAGFAALAAGAAATDLVGGMAALLRNVAGMVGVGLLCAPMLGGSLSWIATMGYLALAEVAGSSGWHSPWIWPARPPDDLGGAICSAIVLVAGLTVIGLRGDRDPTRE